MYIWETVWSIREEIRAACNNLNDDRMDQVDGIIIYLIKFFGIKSIL